MRNPLPYILIGAGGHAWAVADVVGWENISGYIDRAPSARFSKPYYGDDTCAETTKGQELLICIGDNHLRHTIYSKYSKYGKFPTVIADDAYLAENSEISPTGVQILHRALVNAKTKVEDFVIINTGAIVEHECRIGAFSFVGPGAVICGGCSVGEFCFIGAGAVLCPNIQICDNVTIGAGAVVIKDITEEGTYVGNPAKKIK